MSLTDLESDFSCLKLATSHTSENVSRIHYDMFT